MKFKYKLKFDKEKAFYLAQPIAGSLSFDFDLNLFWTVGGSKSA